MDLIFLAPNLLVKSVSMLTVYAKNYLRVLFICLALWGSIYSSPAFCCSPLAKIGLRERLSGIDFDSTFPDLQLDTDHKGIKVLTPYLGEKQKDWYSLSIALPKAGVDPLYAELAKFLKTDVVLGGGSDLIEVGLLKTAKQASLSEINLVMRKELIGSPDGFDELWQDITLSAPAYKGRKALNQQTVSINGESGMNISAMVENSEKGKHLIERFFPLSVPFKHGHAVVVKADGSARLYFRTTGDLENYAAKRLTLPEEESFPSDWHMQPSHHEYLLQTLKYHMNVYARAKPLGWTYSQKSKEILLSWVKEFKAQPQKVDQLKTLFLNGAKAQEVSEEAALKVWTEFGF